MNDAIANFLNYLTDTRNYSLHTVTAYESDIRDFVSFYERFTDNTLFVRDMANIDTICFRSYLADAQRRGLSAKSVARSLSSLRSFYKFLTKKYNINNEAIGLISSPKMPRKISKAIDTIDVENMRAEKIIIIVSGRAAMADARSVAGRVENAGLGECEVKIDLAG